MKKLQNKMLAISAFTALMFVFAFQLNAQKAEFGARFMPTFSSFELTTSTGGTVQGEGELGYGFGAFLGFNFSNHIGIQGEVIYSTHSQKYTEADVQREVELKYVNIPLLFSLNTDKSKGVNFNAVVGPQIGISVGTDLFTSGTGTPGNEAVLSVKKGDLGFAYGAGVDFALNAAHTIRLGVGYRGVFGLFDISDNNSTLTTDSYYVLDRTQIKTNAGYAGLSFMF